MTYGEIYDEIMLKAFTTTPPENMPAYIRRKIRACQRMINRDYNFWFTLITTTITTIPNQRVYALPERFKEIEKTYFQINLQNYMGPVLTQIGLVQDMDYNLLTDNTAVEYPNTMKIDGSNIHLYPLPNAVRILYLTYWKFLLPVEIDDIAVFRAYSDDFSVYCCEAIIFHIMADIKLDQNEWQASQMYKQEYQIAIEGARFEDTVRRSIPENEVIR